jgi:hypothetical protein
MLLLLPYVQIHRVPMDLGSPGTAAVAACGVDFAGLQWVVLGKACRRGARTRGERRLSVCGCGRMGNFSLTD